MRRRPLLILNTFALIAFAGISTAFGGDWDGNSSDAPAKPLVEQSWSFPKTTTLHVVRLEDESRAALVLCGVGEACQIIGSNLGYRRQDLDSIANGVESQLSGAKSSRYAKVSVGAGVGAAATAAVWLAPFTGGISLGVTAAGALLYTGYQGLHGYFSESDQASLAQEFPSAINAAFASGQGKIEGLAPDTWKQAINSSTGQMSAAQVATESISSTLSKSSNGDDYVAASDSDRGGYSRDSGSGRNSGGDGESRGGRRAM